MSGGKKGVALAGGVSLLLGSSVGALTVWLANVSWVIAALVALAAIFMFYAWGAHTGNGTRPTAVPQMPTKDHARDGRRRCRSRLVTDRNHGPARFK